MLAMTMPTAGTVISVRAEETSKALVKMAEKRPKMLAALKRMSEVGPAGEIVQTIIMVIIAAQIDAGRVGLEDQLAAMKQSGCVKDPQMGNMIADIVRGHEDDLAAASRSTARSECR